eukprot:Amastigsp_a174936_128.p4 type:complete len:124 gc:universal Amastigsp_a174936_128:778-407(-)
MRVAMSAEEWPQRAPASTKAKGRGTVRSAASTATVIVITSLRVSEPTSVPGYATFQRSPRNALTPSVSPKLKTGTSGYFALLGPIASKAFSGTGTAKLALIGASSGTQVYDIPSAAGLPVPIA